MESRSQSSSHNGPAGPGGAAKDIRRHLETFLTQVTVPMVVKAVLELGIPEVLAGAEGGRPMSAAEIVAKLPTKSKPGPRAFGNLRRLLRPLVAEGVFTVSFNGEQEPVYGLTEISKRYIKDDELSIYPAFAHILSPLHTATFDRLAEVLLDDDGASPLESAMGMPLQEYYKKNPQFGAMARKCMTTWIRWDGEEMVQTLQQSGWLDDVQTLVDVGGAEGKLTGQIVAQIGHMQGINFDLPQVIDGAVQVNGVQHVRGDFFKQAVPSGDAMLLRYIIHGYDDEKAATILKNCFDALPKNGKIILGEMFVVESDSSSKAKYVNSLDMGMLTMLKGARERTEAEYQGLMAAAGFSLFSVIHSETGMDFIRGVKE